MTSRISNLVSRIVVLTILLFACRETVCNGLFSKVNNFFRGRNTLAYELLSKSPSNEAHNKLYDLMEQCREAQFVPKSSPLWWTSERCQPSTRPQVPSSCKHLHPEFLHYIARHVRNNMPDGVESDDFRNLCEDAAKAGFPGLGSELVQRLQPEDYTVVSDFDIFDNNFLSLLDQVRKFGPANRELPIHDRITGTPQRGFWELLAAQGTFLLQNDRAKLQILYEDGVKAGYKADVNRLKKYLKKSFPEL